MRSSKFNRLKSNGPESFPWKKNKQNQRPKSAKKGNYRMDEKLFAQVLSDTLCKISQGQPVEKAIENTVTILKKQNPSNALEIIAAGERMKTFAAEYSADDYLRLHMIAGMSQNDRQFKF